MTILAGEALYGRKERKPPQNVTDTVFSPLPYLLSTTPWFTPYRVFHRPISTRKLTEIFIFTKGEALCLKSYKKKGNKCQQTQCTAAVGTGKESEGTARIAVHHCFLTADTDGYPTRNHCRIQLPLNKAKNTVQAMRLSVNKLCPFEGHPFQIKDDAEMNQRVWSILTQGLLTPVTVRSLENNEYEVISGHRRLHVCQKAGIEMVPALIYTLDRDGAAIALVHSCKIAPTPAVELSYLTRQEQRDLLETMESEDCTPSLSQAIQMKKLSQVRELNIDKIFDILREPKTNQQDKISFRTMDLKKYFPKSYDAARIQAHIIKLLEADYRKRQRAQER